MHRLRAIAALTLVLLLGLPPGAPRGALAQDGPPASPEGATPLEALIPNLTPDVLGIGPAAIEQKTSPSGKNSFTLTESGTIISTVTGESNSGVTSANFASPVKGLTIPPESSVVVSERFAVILGADRARHIVVIGSGRNSYRAAVESSGLVQLQHTSDGTPNPTILAQGYFQASDSPINLIVDNHGDGNTRVFIDGNPIVEGNAGAILGTKTVSVANARKGAFDSADIGPVTQEVIGLSVYGRQGESPLAFLKPGTVASSNAAPASVPAEQQPSNPGLGLVWQRPREEVGDGPWMGNTRMCLESEYDEGNVECSSTRLQIPLNEKVYFVYDIANVRVGEKLTTRIYGVRRDGNLALIDASVYNGIINDLGRRLGRGSVSNRFIMNGNWSMQSRMGDSATDFRFQSR